VYTNTTTVSTSSAQDDATRPAKNTYAPYSGDDAKQIARIMGPADSITLEQIASVIDSTPIPGFTTRHIQAERLRMLAAKIERLRMLAAKMDASTERDAELRKAALERLTETAPVAPAGIMFVFSAEKGGMTPHQFSNLALELLAEVTK
jgi:hypothetical protein